MTTLKLTRRYIRYVASSLATVAFRLAANSSAGSGGCRAAPPVPGPAGGSEVRRLGGSEGMRDGL